MHSIEVPVSSRLSFLHLLTYAGGGRVLGIKGLVTQDAKLMLPKNAGRAGVFGTFAGFAKGNWTLTPESVERWRVRHGLKKS